MSLHYHVRITLLLLTLPGVFIPRAFMPSKQGGIIVRTRLARFAFHDSIFSRFCISWREALGRFADEGRMGEEGNMFRDTPGSGIRH